MSIRWHNTEVPDSPWLLDGPLRREFKKLMAVHIGMGVLVFIGLARLVTVAHTPPPLTVLDEHGMEFRTKANKGTPPLRTDNFLAYTTEILETAFFRNEGGIAKDALAPYVEPGFADAVGATLEKTVQEGYFQTFVVQRSRLHGYNGKFAAVRLQGSFTSGNVHFYSDTTYTFEVVMRRDTHPDPGQAAWRAYSLETLSNLEYDPDAVRQAIRDQTEAPSEDDSPPNQ